MDSECYQLKLFALIKSSATVTEVPNDWFAQSRAVAKVDLTGHWEVEQSEFNRNGAVSISVFINRSGNVKSILSKDYVQVPIGFFDADF